MLRGTGVSEGCGIGKALIIQHRSLDYSGVVFGGAQQEKERLRAAINAFMQKTEQLRDRLQASAGEKEAAILDGHMEMLRDPFMLSQMEEMIDGGATAEAAADGVCNQFIAMFSGMDDELTREPAILPMCERICWVLCWVRSRWIWVPLNRVRYWWPTTLPPL